MEGRGSASGRSACPRLRRQRLFQGEYRQQQCACGDDGGPDKGGHRSQVAKHPAKGWAKDKADAKGCLHQAQALGAVLLRRDVGDIGLGSGDIAPRDAVQDAGHVEHDHATRHWQGQPPGVDHLAQRDRQDEQDEGQHRPDLAHDQHRPAAVPVGQATQPGSGQELGGKERGGQ